MNYEQLTNTLQQKNLHLKDTNENDLEQENSLSEENSEIDICYLISYIDKIESRTKRVLKKKFKFMKFRQICDRFETVKSLFKSLDLINERELVLNKYILLNIYLHVISCCDEQCNLKLDSYLKLVNKMIDDVMIMSENKKVESTILLNNVVNYVIQMGYNINISKYFENISKYQEKNNEIVKRSMMKKFNKIRKVFASKMKMNMKDLENKFKEIEESGNNANTENNENKIENSVESSTESSIENTGE